MPATLHATHRWLVAILALLAMSPTVSAGDRCTEHFPELRAFVEASGTRATPNDPTARTLADELAIERALWSDEVEYHRERLMTAGALVGITRLDTIDTEIREIFDQLSTLLTSRGALNAHLIDRLLDCGEGDGEWPIRSAKGPAIEAAAVHREAVIDVNPPPGYHEPPGGALRTTTKADPDEVWPEDPLSPVVIKADELGHDPVALYTFVLNEIRAEHYLGSLKSPAVVLLSGGGNDADQALLLAQLLRASGYPARLAHGVVEFPTDRLTSHFAVADTAALEGLLTTMGAAWNPVGGGVEPAAYRVERFWCEVWIPYANFRGIELDSSGETWAVLDPEFEDRGPPSGRRVFDEMAFDATTFLHDYLAGDFCGPSLMQPGACPAPRVLVSSMVDQFLLDGGEPVTYEDLAMVSPAIADDLPILPASMTGHIVSVGWVGLEPPLEDRHRLRLVARDGGLVLLDEVIPLDELSGREAAIWYVPATPDDEQIIRAYDNFLWNVPPYLLQVTPQIIHRGGEIVRGAAGTGMGRTYELEVTHLAPGGASTGFSNREVTGVPTTIAIAAGETGYSVLGDEPASSLEVLAGLADTYLEQDHAFASELAVLGGHGLAYGRPSLAFIGNEVTLDGFLGLVQAIDWRGIYLDADIWGPRAAGGDSGARHTWRTLAQLGGSVAERAVFEAFGATSVSADLTLILADRLGIEVLLVNQSNLSTVLPSIPYQPQILAEIEAWVLAGGEALVPAQAMGLHQWSGVGYLLIEPNTGEARYQLAGALSGGSTTEPPADVFSDFGLALWPPTQYPVNTDPTEVVAVRKLSGFDGAEGTVGEDAEVDIRVEALDHHGARVAGVPITFESVAGGGSVVDTMGNPHASLSVVTDEHGSAVVGFRFGTDTSANPVYSKTDPNDEHASEALLHLIDAVGQGFDDDENPIDLLISEPFWAVAFPDVATTLRRTDTTQTHFVGFVAQWVDTIYLAAEDQYGNPVSNVPVTFQTLPLEINASCSNELPGHLQKNGAVFDNLLVDGLMACGGHPVLGSCGGSTLTKNTAHIGTSAGVIEGNVVAATNRVEASAPGLAALTYTYSHNWAIDGETGACDTLDRFGVFSNFLSDEDGHNVNAAAVSTLFNWPIDFWIEFYEPEPRADYPPFYAGGGQWRPVCGSDFQLPVSNSGAAAQPVLNSTNYSYRTFVTTGPLPAVNEIALHGANFTYCDTGTPLVHPFDGHVNDVWGVRPEITDFDPDVAVLTPDQTLAQPWTIGYQIEPPEYVARSVEIEVKDQTDGVTTLWPASHRTGQGSTVLPRGEEIELDHAHTAAVIVNRAHPAELRSADEPIPLFQPIFEDVTRWFQVSQELDVVDRTTCAEYDVFSFRLNHAATVTLTFIRETPTGPGNPEPFINNAALDAGDHSFTFSPSSATAADFTLTPGSYDFALHGISQADGHSETVAGDAVSTFAMRDTLPVGHAMVKGVDLFDGHLVLSREDMAVPGRGVPLSFDRSYSSSSAEPGHLGQGWTHNWLARVVETPCAELILIGTEGSGMRFTPDGAGGWKPPRGYHGTLILDDASDAIDFYTTGGTHYHFLRVTTLAGIPLGEWYLDFVEDPSGNRTTLHYEEGGDGLPRVRRVVEPTGRELSFTYEHRIFTYWAGDVLTRVDGPGGIEVNFDYDLRGNLVDAGRENQARFEHYDYEIIAFRDVLTSVTNNLNGASTAYEYSNDVLGLVGPDQADIFLVRQLSEPEGGITRFFYDTVALAANADTLTTWVRDPRSSSDSAPSPGNEDPYDTTYTLNHYGSPTAITDPLGHSTSMGWKPDDIVMDWRTDANGVTTAFTYDDHGNLLTETVTVTDVDDDDHEYVVTNTYVSPMFFDPPYIKNRIATHTDRNDGFTTFSYDQAGRLTGTAIDVKAVDGSITTISTAHTYDPATGDRWTTTDPRNHTTSFGYDSHGNLASTSAEVTDHLNETSTVSTSTVWDIRGRPVERTDPRLFVTEFGYDTLDRLTITTYPEVEVDEEVFWRPVESVAYDDVANTVTTTDGNTHETISHFDLQGRLVLVENPVGGSKIIGYDKAGNKDLETSVFDGDTPRFDTFFFYDHAGRLTVRAEPWGRRTSFDYDGVGNITLETLESTYDPLFEARITATEYDRLNRAIKVTRDPGPSGMDVSTTMLLDGEGNVVRLTDAAGRETHHRYDELSRRIETVEPEWRPGRPKTTQFFYDGNGNLVRQERANQRLEADGTWSDADQVRLGRFDELNRSIVATDAEGQHWISVFDRSGNVVEEIDPRGNRISHDYDRLNRRTRTFNHLTDPTTGFPWNVVTSRIFDAVGNLRHEIWPNDNKLTHTYDGANRLLSSADSIGPLGSFEYDARGNRILATDGNGHTTTNHFDGLNRLTMEQLPEHRDIRYGWDVAGNQISLKNAAGRQTDFHFDVLDRLVTTEYAEFENGLRYTSSSTYDLVGNQLTATDLNGHTTTFIHDDFNRVVEVLDPSLAGPPSLQYSTTTTYDAVGNTVGQIDRRGFSSRSVYDRENRPTESYRDGVRIAFTEYDAAGNPEFFTDANDHTTRTFFDERNLEIRIERPESAVTTLTRDAMGDVVTEIDAEGIETIKGFDLRRRLTFETNGEDETTIFAYDFVGNLTTIERPNGPDWTWTRRYDEADRLKQVIDPFNETTTYEYTGQDNIKGRVDAKNRGTYIWYDVLDRLTDVWYPDGAHHAFTYDGNGNRTTATDPNGQTATSIYDELNREILRTYSAPVHPVGDVLQTIAFTWDANSNLVDATETYAGGSRTTHHQWDTFDRLDIVTDGFGKVLDYGYDLNGNRTSLIDPDGETTLYQYDGLNRLDTVTLPGGVGITDYDWRRDGLLRRVTYPNGTFSTYGYDDAKRVTAIENLGPGGASLSAYGYGYDANGNRTLQHETNGGAPETTTYDYDHNDRLWRIAYPDQTTTYSFDAVSNRTSERSVDGTNNTLVDRGYHYNGRDWLLQVNDHVDSARSINYAYDPNGNQVQRTQNGATLDFRYDSRDQLLEVDVDGSNAWTFGFDYRGLRVTKWGADGLLRYTYDGSSVLQQHSALGDPVASYRYGPDRLLAVDHFSQGLAYYHFDALGSIANLTDPAGNVQNRYQYDAWGNHRSQSGALWNPFGFTGHEYDQETGLYYAKARFYDPEVGRFLSEDPAEPDLTTPPSLHKYLYAYGNPTVWIDPLGRNVVDPRFKVDDRFPHYEFEDQIYAVNPLNGEVYRQHATRYSALDPNDADQAETIAVINSMTGASLPENYWRLQTMYEMAGHQLTEAEEKQAQREIASAAVGFTPGLETAQELAIFATGKDPVTGQYVGAGEYVTNTIGMALPFVSLRGGKHLFKSGSKRTARGKGKALIVEESGGMRAVVRNIDTGNEYVIVPRRGTGTSPGDAPRPPKAAGGAREPPPALPAPRTAEELRQTPGLASGGSDLPIVEGKWFKGTQGSAAPIPQQIAKQLSGKRFENIRGFREAFWKAVSEDPKLSRGWTDENLREMAAGRAPWAQVNQRAGGHVKYILHHKTPISQGGGVYDLDNIMIVTPRYHSEVLESKYHGGG